MQVNSNSSGSVTGLEQLGLTVEQAARLLSMALSGGAKCRKEGPRRPEYQALVALGVARMASYSNPHFTHYWLAADRPTVEQLRAWQAGLTGETAEELARAFALLDEEQHNAFCIQNGYPQLQTFHYVPLPEGMVAPEKAPVASQPVTPEVLAGTQLTFF